MSAKSIGKAQLAKEVSAELGMNQTNTQSAIDAVLIVIERHLKAGTAVELRGFGRFSVAHRSGRTARNPRTGEPVTIADHNVVKFKPGKELEAAIR